MSCKRLTLTTFALCIALLARTAPAAAQTPAPVPAPDPAAPPAAAAPAPADPAAPAPAAPSDLPPSAPPPADAPPPPPVDPVPAPPPADSAQTTEPRYDGELDENGRAHYGDEEDEWHDYDDPSYPEPEDDPDPGSDSGSAFPPFSIRLDPFNWLIEGRLGLELEVGLGDLPFTVELIPVFVANTEPPAFNFEGREDPISQHSNGVGPIAGASIGIGWWFQDRALSGYVLRAVLTNIGIEYEATDDIGVFDRVVFTERRFVVYLGSHSRFGFFTIAGGIGLGYELNQQERCYKVPTGTTRLMLLTSDCDDEQQIALERPGTRAMPQVTDLNGWIHPVYLEGRFSVGVSFD